MDISASTGTLESAIQVLIVSRSPGWYSTLSILSLGGVSSPVAIGGLRKGDSLGRPWASTPPGGVLGPSMTASLASLPSRVHLTTVSKSGAV